MRKKLVILGASYLQSPLIGKALSKSLDLTVISSEERPHHGGAFKYIKCDLIDKEALLSIVREISPEGISSIASDITALAVSYVVQHLQLPGEQFNKVSTICDKRACKHLLNARGFTSIATECSEEIAKERVRLGKKVVIKPTDRSGSRGVSVVENLHDFDRQIALAKNLSFSGSFILEEYLEGKEFSLETISIQGRHFLLGVTEKFLGENSVVEQAHVQGGVTEPDLIKKFTNFITQLLDTLDYKVGPAHIEVKLSEDGRVNLIEIGPRMGGDFIGSHLVQLSSKIDFCDLVLELALGNSVPDPKIIWESLKLCGVLYAFPTHDGRCQHNWNLPEGVTSVETGKLSSGSLNVGSSSDRLGYNIWKSRSKTLNYHDTTSWLMMS